MLDTAMRWLSEHAPREVATARALLECTERPPGYMIVCAFMDAARGQVGRKHNVWRAACDQGELLRESWCVS